MTMTNERLAELVPFIEKLAWGETIEGKHPKDSEWTTMQSAQQILNCHNWDFRIAKKPLEMWVVKTSMGSQWNWNNETEARACMKSDTRAVSLHHLVEVVEDREKK